MHLKGSDHRIFTVFCACLLMTARINLKVTCNVLWAFLRNQDSVSCESQAFFIFALGKTMRDKCLIGSERDQISWYSTYHA